MHTTTYPLARLVPIGWLTLARWLAGGGGARRSIRLRCAAGNAGASIGLRVTDTETGRASHDRMRRSDHGLCPAERQQ